ncbi:MAG: ABC transporter ATP-binding protein [Candidatus Heteroscillospira sp.]|jgi:ABC-2 type transport system ATP-binding protein
MLEARDIRKSYFGSPVLRGVSLSLSPGECLGLAGGNGSGKSTLMRIIAQIIPADGGQLLLDGKSVLGDRAFLRSRLGYVPQEDALCPELTVGRQLDFWRGAIGKSCPEADELLNLRELYNKRITSLSGGQRKRVSIAMALQSSPEYLIMDEAFASLDAEYRRVLTEYLKRRLSEGAAMLWCSHEAEELQLLCTRVCVLSDGTVK